jgi:tRNA dimethylallyltransferase
VLGTDCWILSGPTAAGKTALALDLAARLDAEIVSVDSMAVYRGLDIGTAKPSPHEQSRVPHHVIDVVPPGEPYSIARWLADAAAALHAIRGRGRRILFVGGTPLYLRALRDGLAPLPAEDPAFRRQLLDEVDTHGSAAVHARLATIDPVAAARIHPNDVKRIVRALEVAHTSGRPISAAFAPDPHPIFDTQMLVVDLPRRLLGERIDRRVEEMFDRGLVDEVRQAAAQPGGIGPTARQAAGYAECLELLAGRLSLADAIRLTQQRTRQLAKRQLTWLRSFKGAVWITA